MQTLCIWPRSQYGKLDRNFSQKINQGPRAAVEGTVSGTVGGREYKVRFSTFLVVEKEKIIHHVDYVDDRTMREQVGLSEE